MLRGLHFILFEKTNTHHVISENLIAVALAIRIEQLAFIITSALCTCARAVLFTLIFGLPNAINIR